MNEAALERMLKPRLDRVRRRAAKRLDAMAPKALALSKNRDRDGIRKLLEQVRALFDDAANEMAIAMRDTLRPLAPVHQRAMVDRIVEARRPALVRDVRNLMNTGPFGKAMAGLRDVERLEKGVEEVNADFDAIFAEALEA
jgi:hypothetical protein